MYHNTLCQYIDIFAKLSLHNFAMKESYLPVLWLVFKQCNAPTVRNAACKHTGYPCNYGNFKR